MTGVQRKCLFRVRFRFIDGKEKEVIVKVYTRHSIWKAVSLAIYKAGRMVRERPTNVFLVDFKRIDGGNDETGKVGEQ